MNYEPIRGRWIYDPDTGKLIPFGQYKRRVKNYKESLKLRSHLPSPQIMRDIEPFRNVAIDGREISSRSSKREMMKRNNLMEIGSEFRPTKRQMKKKTSVKESMKRAMQELGIR